MSNRVAEIRARLAAARRRDLLAYDRLTDAAPADLEWACGEIERLQAEARFAAVLRDAAFRAGAEAMRTRVARTMDTSDRLWDGDQVRELPIPEPKR
jgi:hypothetical protein